MIVQEPFFNELIYTHSDSGHKIIQIETGIEYDEAIDIPNKHTYHESENLIVEDGGAE